MSIIENIVVFGVGAAGSNTFLNLLFAYPDFNFIVVDFDKVENRNVEPGTQPYTKADLNRPKTQALQRIAMTLKQKRIQAINTKIQSVKDIEKLVSKPNETIILDAFDNADSRNVFLSLGKKYNVIHIGFSAFLTGEAVWNEVFEPMISSKADDDIDVCEMSIARQFISDLTELASIVISKFVENNEKVNLYFDKNFIIKTF